MLHLCQRDLQSHNQKKPFNYPYYPSFYFHHPYSIDSQFACVSSTYSSCYCYYLNFDYLTHLFDYYCVQYEVTVAPVEFPYK